MADIGAHSTSGGVTGASPFTWSHTVTVDDTYLVVCVRTRDSVAADSQATAVTFNGDALSLLHRSSAIPSGASDTHTVEWWSLRTPDVGTFTVSVTTGGSLFRGGLSATNLRGIATTGELLATATNSGANTATEATVSVSSTEAGAVVLLAMYSGASGATLSGATQRDLTSFETDITGLASSIPSSVQTVTATWTHDAAEAIGSMASAIVLRSATTSSTITPDSTVSNTSWSAVGAATLHGALVTGDTDYITASTTGAVTELGLSNPAAPLTLTDVSFRVRARLS